MAKIFRYLILFLTHRKDPVEGLITCISLFPPQSAATPPSIAKCRATTQVHAILKVCDPIPSLNCG